METKNNKLAICTFNCRSVKNSVHEVRELCEKFDLILIQEHWLLPNELGMLNNIHPEFMSVAHSAVDISHDVLVGRPYGGTAILYRKSLSNFITRVSSPNPRISAVVLQTDVGPLLVVCVYMRTDYGTAECHEEFIATCAKITALYADCNAVHLVAAGDFNCQHGSRFYDSFVKFANDNNLCFTDSRFLYNDFTYSNDSCTSYSWIDHVLCSPRIDAIADSCMVLYDFISSDHKPLLTVFNCLLSNQHKQVHSASGHVDKPKHVSDWAKADDTSILNYQYNLDLACSTVSSPSLTLLDNADYNKRVSLIDSYYNKIMWCINVASRSSIPIRLVGSNYVEYVVPGWNNYVKDKHIIAREAFLEWNYAGKPRDSPLHYWMQKTRANFKLALRYCKQHKETVSADIAAESLASKDYYKFWKTIQKQNNDKATKFAQVVDGCSGEAAIAEWWRQHFNKLYNSVSDNGSKVSFQSRITNSLLNAETLVITVSDVVAACHKQKLGKAPGPDGIAMEALIFGSHRLHVHLCVLFNLFIRFSYLPSVFMQSVMIPLVKNKCVDLSDLNNYRAIALSSALSKVLECIVAGFVTTDSEVEHFQFGFKSGHSTSLCTSVLKQTVEYYTGQGSHVFACFLDFNKAFDSVNHWKLFQKLLDDGVNSFIVNLLAYWHCSQSAVVRWHNTMSTKFCISNGVRQGGVLSPYLFTRYIRDMIYTVAGSGIGCTIGGITMNLLAYADDLVLLAPSWKAMQELLSILKVQADNLNLSCNVNKTVCMMFNPRKRDRCITCNFPCFKIGNSSLNFVPKFKYLGHYVTNDQSDDADIQREIHNMFVRTNILLRRFCKCSASVKILLFKSFCLCLYDVALWKVFNTSTYHKFQSCYNKCIKLFFGYKRRDSLTQLLLATGLPSFNTVIHNCQHVFNKSWSLCQNALVAHLQSLTVMF